MTAGWVAADVRGRALLARTLGHRGAVAIAGADSWSSARDLLAASTYGRDLAADVDRSVAREQATRVAAWQLRVLVGWLPPGTTHIGRVAVGPIEIADVDRHLAHLAGAEPMVPTPLGSLGTVGRRVAWAGSSGDVRSTLARSIWGDPGGDDRVAIGFGMRVAWLRRVAALRGLAVPWALGAAVVLVAREQFLFGRTIAERTAHEIDRLLGGRWRHASDPAELARSVGDAASWSIAAIDSAWDLWRAELAVLARVERDALTARHGRPSETSVIAVLALLLLDLWRVTAAIEAAGHGEVGVEVLDAVVA